MKKITILTLSSLLVLFLVLQFIRPGILNSPVTADFQAPPKVKTIVKRACYDCHSNETSLSWYDQVVPVYWQVTADVKKGQECLNFSNWQKMAPADRKGKLWEAVNQIAAGAMPLKSYTVAHQNAKISADDMSLLKAYVNSMAAVGLPDDTAKINAADRQYSQWQKEQFVTNQLPIAPNGIRYIPDYKNWQAISTSARFDNGTMRVIFGNHIAAAAMRKHHIRPWPDGTIFAKAAWDEVEDKDGNIKTGAFKQIEFMIKDKEKYAATEGWGYARFKTPKIIPYGKNTLFTTECVNCHRPQKNEDFVFTQPIKH
jgi:hypothetical protein